MRFEEEPCLFVLEIKLEALSEINASSNLGLKPSKPRILMICSLLMDVSNPGGSTEDVGGVVKEMVSLLTLSEDLGTIFETAV